MPYLLRIAPAAHRDIAGIKEYIAKDKANAAINMAKKIYDSFDGLLGNPLMGGDLKEKSGIDTDYRFWVVKPYIVFYKVEGNFIGIYRILDGRSDYLVKLGLKKQF